MIVTRLFLTVGKWIPPILLAIVLCFATDRNAHANMSAADIDTVIRQLAGSDTPDRAKLAVQIRDNGQATLPRLLKGFHQGDTLQRRGSVMGILMMPYPALGMDVLLEGLGDADRTTRSMAAQGLALIGPAAAPHLVKMLGDDTRAVRAAAGYSLKLMGPKAVPALTDGLTSNDEFIRGKAAWILGRLGADAMSAVPALIRALDAGDLRVMHVVAEAIDLIGPPPAVVVHHLTLLNADTTGCPARRVGGNAAPLLIRLLTRPGTPLAQAAYRALAFMGKPALPALMEGVHGGPMGQRVACGLLAVTIDPTAADALPQDVLDAIRLAQRQPQQ